VPYPLLLHGKHAPGPVLYEPFDGWLVPWRFGDTREEHRALTEGAALLDYSMQALLEVRGEDRVAFLHHLLSQDIKRLQPGQGCRAALLSPEARIVASMLVLAEADACWLLCDAERAAPLTTTLERYLFGERVRITNHERRFATLAIQGRESVTVLSGLGWTIPQADESHAMAIWDGHPLRLVRHALIGDTGALLLIDAAAAERLWRDMQRRAGPRLRLAGWDAYNIARLEAGIPWFGIDVDTGHLLPETGMERRLASDTKGCYVGQEIVARVATYGSPSRRLRGLVLAAGEAPAPGTLVRFQGEDAGRITSSCRSLVLNTPIALAMLKRAAYELGTRVEVDGRTATVVEQPIGGLTPGGTGKTPTDE